MKKLLAIALALVLIYALSVTALADNALTTTLTPPPSPEGMPSPSAQTNLTFNVTPFYTVTIPQSVVLKTDPDNENEHIGSATIEAENVHLKLGEVLRVKVTSNFTLTTEAKYNPLETSNLNYVIKIGEKTSDKEINGSSTADDLIAAVFHSDNVSSNPEDYKKQSQKLTFLTTGTPTYAGTYTGTVTFTIYVYDPNNHDPNYSIGN